jgi:hypothetical protein
MTEMFNLDGFDPVTIARELYDFTKRGLVVIPDFIRADAKECLLDEIVREQIGSTQPDRLPEEIAEYVFLKFKTITAQDPADTRIVPPTVYAMWEAYKEHVLTPLAGSASFVNQDRFVPPPSVMKYHPGSWGISIHQDTEYFRNVVSILNLSGNAKTITYTDSQGSNPQEVETPAGSLSLLRAPRNDDEVRMRPWHSVKNITEERIAIAIREHVF